ncbi:MAG: deoxyguanosinetriphosphate triphosphohydrolase family protein [Calditrichaceae bacterium]
MPIKLQDIASKIDQEESTLLSKFATQNARAIRNNPERDIHSRPPYALDRDRIIYSGAFRRYTGKTQVIYFASMLDEQLTSRSLHTLSVAQISKTIGRFLSLNTDLIDAIALGHDLGHPPFGHDGEKFLSKVSIKHGIGQFHHNIQSLRVVDSIAKKGQGLNLTFQARDGILSHNGEVHNQGLEPNLSKSEKDLTDYILKMEQGDITDMMPATLEGCVVRLTDTIAYIGQDIEDAIRIGLIKRDDLPDDLRSVLGSYNGQIVETLVNDVVVNSYGKKYVSFSPGISAALFKLKEFNYENIYRQSKLKVNHERIERGFEFLFNYYLDSLNKNDRDSEIFQHFLNSKSEKYLNNQTVELMVRDFIAGMTDRYFTQILQKIIIPEATGFQITNG